MSKSKFFSLLYSLGTRLYISIIGELMMAELLAFISLPLVNIKKLIYEYKELKLVIYSLFVLLITQILSDFLNHSDFTDYFRGWAVIIFAIISTIFLTKQFSSNSYSVIYFLIGVFLIKLFFGEGDLDLALQEENSNFFKIRFVGFLNPAILLISFFLAKYNWKRSIVVLFIVYSFICFGFDARSVGLVFLISAIMVYIKISDIYLSRLKIIFGGLFISFILFLGYVFYVDQVLNYGYGGNNAKIQLSETDNPYNPFVLIYNGRREVFVALYAIADKPIIGHGSWAKDVDGRYGKLLASLSDSNSVYNKDFIPSHSIIFSSWLYSGLVGFLSLALIFFTLFKHFINYFKYSYFDFFTPIVIVISLEMLWHLFFSPFGHLRIEFPFFASLIIVTINQQFNLSKI